MNEKELLHTSMQKNYLLSCLISQKHIRLIFFFIVCVCVIAEICDYGQGRNIKSPGYILLCPRIQTLICHVHSIISDNYKWTQEDKLLLEIQLILATVEPLCLGHSIAITCIENRLLCYKQKMNKHPMTWCFRRYSRSSLNLAGESASLSTSSSAKIT